MLLLIKSINKLMHSASKTSITRDCWRVSPLRKHCRDRTLFCPLLPFLEQVGQTFLSDSTEQAGMPVLPIKDRSMRCVSTGMQVRTHVFAQMEKVQTQRSAPTSFSEWRQKLPPDARNS